jgi:hypothetical protein
MKRTKSGEKEKKGVVISLTDVYEVTFLKDTTYHKKSDKKLVSLPLAKKLSEQKKVSLSEEAKAKVKELNGEIEKISDSNSDK